MMTAANTSGRDRRNHVPGTVYLIHVNEPYKHARHYLGWAEDVDARLARHADGSGARLLQVVRAAGIGWQLARTWNGDRYRERQLKKQGGRSRLCPICKDTQPKPAAAGSSRDAVPGIAPDPAAADAGFAAELPATAASARQARAAVRQALAAWGMAELSADAELLASELVANAAEHGDGNPIGLALRRQADAAGQPAVTCEVSDTSPSLPQARDAGPWDERGRGLSIVAALASASGVQVGSAGKTAWFTLALASRAQHVAQPAEAQPQAEAGA